MLSLREEVLPTLESLLMEIIFFIPGLSMELFLYGIRRLTFVC